jgi:uncharacterized protein
MTDKLAYNHGLTARDIQTIFGIFAQYQEVKNVVLFGSRAKGTYHSGSDIDLAIMDDNITDELLRRLSNAFEESSLPYKADLVSYHTITSEELRAHIDRVGKVFYRVE